MAEGLLLLLMGNRSSRLVDVFEDPPWCQRQRPRLFIAQLRHRGGSDVCADLRLLLPFALLLPIVWLPLLLPTLCERDRREEQPEHGYDGEKGLGYHGSVLPSCLASRSLN